LQGKIKGHVVKITETIENYLENFMSNKPRMNTVHISKLSLLKSSNYRAELDQEMMSHEAQPFPSSALAAPISNANNMSNSNNNCQPNL
jgi:hypothetical protein